MNRTKLPHHARLICAIEAMLALAVAVFLYTISQPLASPGIDLGLHARYAPLPEALAGPASWQWLQSYGLAYSEQAIPRAVRTVALLRFGGLWFAILTVSGYLALQVVRSDATGGLWLASGLWAALALLLRPYQVPASAWAAVSAACLLLSWACKLKPAQSTTPSPGRPHQSLWTTLVWPGWAMFTGLGCLLWLDFAARGPIATGPDIEATPGARYFGPYQIDGLWLASYLVILAAAQKARLVNLAIQSGNGLSAVWHRRYGPWRLAASAVPLALLVGWLGAPMGQAYLGITGLAGLGKPHISGELLRLVACVLIAWFAYRVGEWRTSRRRSAIALSRFALGFLGICALGLIASHDSGPLLVLSLGFVILLIVPIARLLFNKGPSLLLGAAALSLTALLAWQQGITVHLPQLSAEAASRGQLMTAPFSSYSPNRAQSLWLQDAVQSPDGFGLGNVPYCGARALLPNGRCTLSSGAFIQMPSDMAFVPLHATFGAAKASLWVVLLLVWLSALPAGQLAAWRNESMPTAQRQRGLLAIWLLAVPALMAQAQTIVSVGATLGWSLLAGVTLPLIGYGSAALCTTALWVGLACAGGTRRFAKTDSHPADST